MNRQTERYIEMALRETIKNHCPEYPERTIAMVIEQSMKNNAAGATKDVLIRAIELAVSDLYHYKNIANNSGEMWSEERERQENELTALRRWKETAQNLYPELARSA